MSNLHSHCILVLVRHFLVDEVSFYKAAHVEVILSIDPCELFMIRKFVTLKLHFISRVISTSPNGVRHSPAPSDHQ